MWILKFILVSSLTSDGGGAAMILNNLVHNKLIKMMEFSLTSLFYKMCLSSGLEHVSGHKNLSIRSKAFESYLNIRSNDNKKVHPEALYCFI